MSTPPPRGPETPYAPPAPSGPPPPPEEGKRLPWEERGRLGFFEALVQTIRLIITDPADGFSRLRQDGDITSPVLFALVLGFLSLLFSQLWQVLFASTYRSLFRSFDGFEGVFGQPSLAAFVGTLVVGPVFFVILLFIGSGILHLCLMIVGATERSPTGFEGTLKVYAYAQVAGLATALPVLGGLAFAVWALVLEVMGFAVVHRTTHGRALGAVLIPVGLCCLCAMLLAVFFGAMLSAMFAGMGHSMQ